VRIGFSNPFPERRWALPHWAAGISHEARSRNLFLAMAKSPVVSLIFCLFDFLGVGQDRLSEMRTWSCYLLNVAEALRLLSGK